MNVTGINPAARQILGLTVTDTGVLKCGDIAPDSYIQKDVSDYFYDRKTREFDNLQSQISESGKQVSALVAELKKKEKELADVKQKFEKQMLENVTSVSQAPSENPHQNQDRTVDQLKQKIVNLKHEIMNQQIERRTLREELKGKELELRKKQEETHRKTEFQQHDNGLEYRLMLTWIKNVSVCALDIIKRADLETWLKQHA